MLPLWWGALICVIAVVGAQICNDRDPESGGVILPAIGHGTAVVCLPNSSDPLGLTYVRADNASLSCTKDQSDPNPYWGLYMFLLLWSFAGVGIIADVFMDAIAVITSSGKWLTRINSSTGQDEHVLIKRWNPTVANLTLMALGSSAPEIMLSVIEIVNGRFYSGSLGPSTIVGSAAFNMFMILAVCVSALEPGDTRLIKDTSVFRISAFSSVFAYVWLFLILQVFSENVVTWQEGTLSFLFFPVLVVTAYAADKGAFSSVDSERRGFVTQVGVDHTGDGNINSAVNARENKLTSGKVFDSRLLANIDTKDKSKEEVARLVVEANERETLGKTRAHYRKQGVQKMTGSTAKEAAIAAENARLEKLLSHTIHQSQVGFECTHYKTKETVFALEVAVVRVGDCSQKLSVSYTTKDDTTAPEVNRATENVDYVKTSGVLNFKKGESVKTFAIKMIDDDEVEEDEIFWVELFDVSDPEVSVPESRRVCKVTIISDDDPGVMVLAKVPLGHSEEDGYRRGYVTAGSTIDPVACLVRREKGSSGTVAVSWRTIADTAKPGIDYGIQGDASELTGRLVFHPALAELYIHIPIVVNPNASDSQFSVELMDPEGGCVIGEAHNTVRGADGSTTIEIKNDAQAQILALEVAKLLEEHYDEYRTGNSTIRDQLKAAVSMEDGTAGAALVLFYFNLPWRVLFALVPPTHYVGGWLCFFSALVMIAAVTVLIGDLAALLGCALGIVDSVTAITFVALGTSLPDTFASKAATLGDDCADAAIGNVTGSNSVNVFLGLGLPWFMAAVYWSAEGATAEWKGTIGLQYPDIVRQYENGGFVVPAGDLGFSVAVYCTCATMLLITLVSLLLKGRVIYIVRLSCLHAGVPS